MNITTRQKMLNLVNKSLLLAALSLSVLTLKGTDCYGNNEPPALIEDSIINRLRLLGDQLVEARYNSVVRGYIRSYVLDKPEKSELIIGRATMYFPLFEEYLEKHNLPVSLKYLSVVESALVPRIESRVGALGLWQFMPETAREYGLTVNGFVDERCDPNKSTEAALNYLKDLYSRYDDWALALAAYNAGPGRVNRAIRRARSKNFWLIHRYLPRETRNYVPAYIAAVYIMKYYQSHDLKPVYPNLDLQLTESIKVHNYYSFYRIAQVSGAALNVIEQLNPSYDKGFIPRNPEGNFLILPKRSMAAFKEYLSFLDPQEDGDPFDLKLPVTLHIDDEAANTAYQTEVYRVKRGDHFFGIAKAFQVSPTHLLAWNQLLSTELQLGQQLVVFRPRQIHRFEPVSRIEVFAGLAPPVLKELEEKPFAFASGDYLCFIVSRKQKPAELAAWMPGVSTEELVRLNGLKINKNIKPGTEIRIKRL